MFLDASVWAARFDGPINRVFDAGLISRRQSSGQNGRIFIIRCRFSVKFPRWNYPENKHIGGYSAAAGQEKTRRRHFSSDCWVAWIAPVRKVSSAKDLNQINAPFLNRCDLAGDEASAASAAAAAAVDEAVAAAACSFPSYFSCSNRPLLLHSTVTALVSRMERSKKRGGEEYKEEEGKEQTATGTDGNQVRARVALIRIGSNKPFEFCSWP